MTRKSIFEQGKGIDPDPQNFGNSSGTALKYLYSLLELKAGMAEMEFRSGFEELIKAICNYSGIACENVTQTWTRDVYKRQRKLAAIVRGAVAFSLLRVGPLKRCTARRMIRIELKSVRNMYRIEQAILKTRKRHE